MARSLASVNVPAVACRCPWGQDASCIDRDGSTDDAVATEGRSRDSYTTSRSALVTIDQQGARADCGQCRCRR